MSRQPEKPEQRPGSRHHALRRAAGRAARVAVALLVLIAIAAMSGCCERLFYHPTDAVYSTPDQYNLSHEPVTFTSADGTALSGWFLPAVGRAKGTVVHCHGNAQNMTSHWQFAEFLPRRGFNLFVFDYRGYGRSEGSPDRQGTVEDARAAVDYVLGRDDVDPGRVGLFGQSLGGAVATVVAAGDQRVRGLVLDSTFTSYRDEAAHALRANPVTWLCAWPLSRLLIRSGLDPMDYIARIAPRPALLVHGTGDRVVPHEMSRELAEQAGEPKELWLVDGARHTASIYRAGETYKRKVCALFEKAFAAPP